MHITQKGSLYGQPLIPPGSLLTFQFFLTQYPEKILQNKLRHKGYYCWEENMSRAQKATLIKNSTFLKQLITEQRTVPMLLLVTWILQDSLSQFNDARYLNKSTLFFEQAFLTFTCTVKVMPNIKNPLRFIFVLVRQGSFWSKIIRMAQIGITATKKSHFYIRPPCGLLELRSFTGNTYAPYSLGLNHLVCVLRQGSLTTAHEPNMGSQLFCWNVPHLFIYVLSVATVST